MAIAQFWPVGRADADTVNVGIGNAAGTFRFRPKPGAPFKATRAFDGARVRGQFGAREVVRKKRRGLFAPSRFKHDPFDLVYREDPSRLLDANGKPITEW